MSILTRAYNYDFGPDSDMHIICELYLELIMNFDEMISHH